MVGPARPRVLVIGGGIAGLTTAQELAERGVDVTLLESRGRDGSTLGGKALSFRPEAANGMAGEHGFRFFPGFYRSVIQQMESIPAGEGETVADHLVAVPSSSFFADRNRERSSRPGSRPWMAVDSGFRRVSGVTYCALLALSWALSLAASWWVAWIALLAGLALWSTLRLVAARLAGSPQHLEMSVQLPTGPDCAADLGRFARWCRDAPMIGALAAVPLLLTWGMGAVGAEPTGTSWTIATLVAALWLGRRAVGSSFWMWRGLRGRIPGDVRPTITESAWAFAAMLQVVGACPRRRYEELEQRNWWDFINAWRLSDAFQVSLATGLTRSFVATRAEHMSARTGGSILAQLLYDVNPWFEREAAADRILDGPTSEVWITPWIEHLESLGVDINRIESRHGRPTYEGARVSVERLTAGSRGGAPVIETVDVRIEGPPPAGVAADPIGPPRMVGLDDEFDQVVLATSGLAARQILANSPGVIRLDRPATSGMAVAPNPLLDLGGQPSLSGLFSLDYGWMSGIVFHLKAGGAIRGGHLLCLDSPWALTAIEQRRHWRPEFISEADGSSILSVNVSDWFTAGLNGLPARKVSEAELRAEVWRQLDAHIPDLPDRRHLAGALIDLAIEDPDQAEPLAAPSTFASVGPIPEDDLLVAHKPHVSEAALERFVAIENLPADNAERLLVNTAGSWDDRPSTVTGITNLLMAGDHVRSHADFASMEAACETGRWAAREIVERLRVDGHDGPELHEVPCPEPLDEPAAISGAVAVLRRLDRVAYRLGLPHPAAVLTPLLWLTGVEAGWRCLVNKVVNAAAPSDGQGAEFSGDRGQTGGLGC